MGVWVDEWMGGYVDGWIDSQMDDGKQERLVRLVL